MRNVKADTDNKNESRLTLPLWLEVLLCVLPLVIVNVFIQHIVLEKSVNSNEQKQYKAILESAVTAFGARLEDMDGKDIELVDVLEGKDSMVIPISKNFNVDGYKDVDGNNAGTMYYRFYVYTGEGKVLNCDPQKKVITSADKLYDKEEQYIEKAVDTRGTIYETFKLDGCDYIAAFLAVGTSGRNIYYNNEKLADAADADAAVVFCSIADADAVASIQHGSVMRTTIVLAIGFAVMLGILAIILWRELSSLKLMRDTMNAIMDAESDGDDSKDNVAPIDRHFRESEIEDLINVFNRMAGNIKVSLRRTRRLTQMFEPFVPEKLLKMFGKSDIRDVKPGDSMEVMGELVYIRFRYSVEEKRRLELMSELSDALIHALNEDHGMILNFDSNTMIMLFADGAAKEMQKTQEDAAAGHEEHMSEARLSGTIEAYKTWLSGYEEDPGTVMCIDHRSVSVKLIGNDERMQLYISEADLAPVRKLFRSADEGEHGPLYVKSE